jgi:TatD DNase family protein
MQDIHAHLYWESYDDDREAVIARARVAGVREMIVVGTTIEESKKAIMLAHQYENIYAAAGIHPNEFRCEQGEYLEELEQLARDEKVVAIGECGLDYSENHGIITEVQKERQKKALREQIFLATQLHLPVIVHCRPMSSSTQDAYEDLLGILQPEISNLKAVILHCYMGDTVVTSRFLQLPNLYFSFTGNITYPVKKHLVGTKDDLTESVRLIPKERIFVETDCPFLAPQTKRGERNEPVYALYTAEKVCELIGVTRPALDMQLEENFAKVFSRKA